MAAWMDCLRKSDKGAVLFAECMGAADREPTIVAMEQKSLNLGSGGVVKAKATIPPAKLQPARGEGKLAMPHTEELGEAGFVG